ncbi:MAG: hypothetical protein AABZ57_07725 [Candidatus Margulisiibacteriota bacterium]
MNLRRIQKNTRNKSGKLESKISEFNNKYYACEACGLLYVEREWAEKCEKWCAKNKSCNLEITAHRIKDDAPPSQFLNS